jgi:hypothetical protein
LQKFFGSFLQERTFLLFFFGQKLAGRLVGFASLRPPYGLGLLHLQKFLVLPGHKKRAALCSAALISGGSLRVRSGP